MNATNNMDRYLARLLLITFFLPMKLQVWVTMAVSVYFVVRTIKTKGGLTKGNAVRATIISAGFFLFLLAIPFTPHEYLHRLMTLCGQRVSFLFMPFLFAVIAPAFTRLIADELLYFVYGCVLTCVVANAGVAYHYFILKDVAAMTHIAYRGKVHQLTDIHPTYLSMYLGFAICVLLYAGERGLRLKSLYVNLLLFLSFVFLLALGAKTPMLATAAVVVLYFATKRGKLKEYKVLIGTMIVTTVCAWLFVPFIAQRMNEMVQFFSAEKHTLTNDNSVYARQLIWNMDMNLLHHYWLTGVGPGRVYMMMELQSFVRSLHASLPELYHDPHNEYIYEWLCFGLAGVGILVATFLWHIRQGVITKNQLYLCLMVVIVATCFTESILSLQRGIMFYSFFTSMFFFATKEDNAIVSRS